GGSPNVTYRRRLERHAVVRHKTVDNDLEYRCGRRSATAAAAASTSSKRAAAAAASTSSKRASAAAAAASTSSKRASASAAAASTSPCELLAKVGIFFVKDIERAEADVRDFLLS